MNERTAELVNRYAWAIAIGHMVMALICFAAGVVMGHHIGGG